jgi:hypothetical protein
MPFLCDRVTDCVCGECMSFVLDERSMGADCCQTQAPEEKFEGQVLRLRNASVILCLVMLVPATCVFADREHFLILRSRPSTRNRTPRPTWPTVLWFRHVRAPRLQAMRRTLCTLIPLCVGYSCVLMIDPR